MAINQKVTGSGEPTGKAGRAFKKVAPSFRIKKRPLLIKRSGSIKNKVPHLKEDGRREKKRNINVEVSAAIVRRMNKSLMKPFSAHFGEFNERLIV
jgi:hypothetical protein